MKQLPGKLLTAHCSVIKIRANADIDNHSTPSRPHLSCVWDHNEELELAITGYYEPCAYIQYNAPPLFR